MLSGPRNAIAALLFLAAACSSGGGGGEASMTSSAAGTGGAAATSTTSSAGGGGGGGGEGGGGGGSLCPSLGDPCTTCLAVQCQQVYCACQRDAECSAASNCFLSCAGGDEACYPACLAAHAAGASGAALAGSCAAERCEAQCRFGRSLSPCQACLFGECSAEMNACIANRACGQLLSCVGACAGAGGCDEGCATEHPDGVEDAQAVEACAASRCGGTCP
jgi:hypothetical protein